MTTPLEFIEYLLRLINQTENKASNYRVELLKTTIEEYLEGEKDDA